MGMTPAIDVLLDARALLARPNGWIQGDYRKERREGGWAVCIDGAIDLAETRLGGLSGARERVKEVVGGDIPSYNDQPGRQLIEVQEAIDRAIAVEWSEDPIRRAPAEPSSDPMQMFYALFPGEVPSA
jgi:hypothetical protein